MIEVIIIKLDTVAASGMSMHRVLIIATLTFTIQRDTDVNHENHKCSIISETVQAIPHQVCCEDSPTKGLYNRFQSDDLALHSRSPVRFKRDKVVTCTTITISRTVFNLWHSNLA